MSNVNTATTTVNASTSPKFVRVSARVARAICRKACKVWVEGPVGMVRVSKRRLLSCLATTAEPVVRLMLVQGDAVVMTPAPPIEVTYAGYTIARVEADAWDVLNDKGITLFRSLPSLENARQTIDSDLLGLAF